jgi:hypothetical protein
MSPDKLTLTEPTTAKISVVDAVAQLSLSLSQINGGHSERDRWGLIAEQATGLVYKVAGENENTKAQFLGQISIGLTHWRDVDWGHAALVIAAHCYPDRNAPNSDSLPASTTNGSI